MITLAPAALALLLAAPPASAPPTAETTVTVRSSPPDELTEAVAGYPFTLARLESYAAVVRDLRAAARKDPRLAKRLRRMDGRITSIEGSARQVEAVPELQALLAKRGLGGRDFVLLPVVLQASRLAAFAEQSGRPMPPDRVNRAAVAVVQEKGQEVERIAQGLQADLAALAR